MEAATRLTPEELAALAPGDTMIIESGADFRRTRRTAGTVTRVSDTKAFVRVESARCLPYVQELSLRTGWRAGRGDHGALSSAASGDGREDVRRGQQRVDALWRAWSRNRGDVEALGEQLAKVHAIT